MLKNRSAESVEVHRDLQKSAVRRGTSERVANSGSPASAQVGDELPRLLDRREQVDETGQLITSSLAAGGDPAALLAVLGAALTRENRNFHTIQCVEAAIRQHELLGGTDNAALPLVAAARYLPRMPRRPAPSVRPSRSRAASTAGKRSTTRSDYERSAPNSGMSP